MAIHRLADQPVIAEVEFAHRQEQHQRAADQQQECLDDLHPGGCHHTAEGHIQHHQRTDDHQGDLVVQAEQQPDQLPGPDHLRHQVETHHGQRADGGHGAHLALVETVRGDVGEGEAAQVAQPLGHQ